MADPRPIPTSKPKTGSGRRFLARVDAPDRPKPVLADTGIRHLRTRPPRPQTNGKPEGVAAERRLCRSALDSRNRFGDDGVWPDRRLVISSVSSEKTPRFHVRPVTNRGRRALWLAGVSVVSLFAAPLFGLAPGVRLVAMPLLFTAALAAAIAGAFSHS